MERMRGWTFTVIGLLAAASVYAGGASEPAGGGQHMSEIPSLAKVYAPYFPVGAAVDVPALTSQGALLASQVDSLTPENDMKWENIHPKAGNDPDDYFFGPADKIVAFARRHGMLVRGHNFVWHQQVPGWIFRRSEGETPEALKAQVLGALKDHIDTLMKHFHGSVYCWDVVNEAISDGSDVYRTDSPWYLTAGSDDDGDGIPDYIVAAFRDAREADPSVKLFYNDYNISGGAKFEKAFGLAKALKAKGLLDGIGIQGHWQTDAADPEAVRTAIEQFASLGLTVQITELDLSVYAWGDNASLPSLPAQLAQRQADAYGALFAVFRDEAKKGNLSGVTFWGIADDHTWLDDFPVQGRKDYPLPFDSRHNPKPAFWSIARF